MIGKLLRFSIFNLWSEKNVHLKFDDNILILVGENGSGKTTILRILYETLACKWAMLSMEDFSKITLFFENGESLTICKSEIQSAKELFVDTDSLLFRKLPPIVRRSLMERSHLSGRDISYDQIVEAVREYDCYNQELVSILEEKMQDMEKSVISEYEKSIKKN